MLSPALLRAQTGVIEGEVAAAGTGEPLTGAGVFVQELDIGRLSQPSGRFPVENMPPGSDALTAQRAGYVTKDTGAAVSAGQAVAVNLQMDDRAVALDEIVVTGLAGGARRRTIGNDRQRLDIAGLREGVPAATVDEVLRGSLRGRMTGCPRFRVPARRGCPARWCASGGHRASARVQ